MKDYILHLENAAPQWDNASPVGCGSAGLMIYGGVAKEKLAINEESIWAGGPIDTIVEGFPEKLDYIRKLFLDGKEVEAEKWARENLMDYIFRIGSYEYAGELHVDMHEDDKCDNYKRDIDLIKGICTVSYEKDGIVWNREYFASYPSKLLCARFTAGSNFNAKISFERENLVSLEIDNDMIAAKGKTETGENYFKVFTKIKTDGKRDIVDGALKITDASYFETYTAVVTSFKYDNLDSAGHEILSKAECGWDSLKTEHTADHSALMTRSELCFNSADKYVERLPVNERLKRLFDNYDINEEITDYSLISLYWQFGKYLLIGSSRPGTLPANLQGVWADGLHPAWSSDYHTNINLQMNYWQAEEANITECNDALFDYMNNYLLPGGKKYAREAYKMRGMVVHHLSDIYGFAAPADGLHGVWQVGGAWLAYHMWEHYLYTNDKEFLRNTAYEYIKECVLFFLDFLFEGNDGYLHSGPSSSPENKYMVDGKAVTLAISPTMDIQIIGGLFDFYMETEKILGIDPETAEEVKKARAKLPPMQIGKYGQLMEWYKDYDEEYAGHRHISHSFAFYPSAQITRNTPELFEAISKTIERRLAFGGGHTGWSRAWLINLIARLGDGENAYENIRKLFKSSTLPNMFDSHPPFQIDGNFGAAAGISEMVMQSHEGYISIIPAISERLNGYFKNLRARGGVTVSAEWEDGVVKRVELTPDRPMKIKLLLPYHDLMEIDAEDTVVIEE